MMQLATSDSSVHKLQLLFKCNHKCRIAPLILNDYAPSLYISLAEAGVGHG